MLNCIFVVHFSQYGAFLSAWCILVGAVDWVYYLQLTQLQHPCAHHQRLPHIRPNMDHCHFLGLLCNLYFDSFQISPFTQLQIHSILSNDICRTFPHYILVAVVWKVHQHNIMNSCSSLDAIGCISAKSKRPHCTLRCNAMHCSNAKMQFCSTDRGLQRTTAMSNSLFWMYIFLDVHCVHCTVVSTSHCSTGTPKSQGNYKSSLFKNWWYQTLPNANDALMHLLDYHVQCFALFYTWLHCIRELQSARSRSRKGMGCHYPN